MIATVVLVGNGVGVPLAAQVEKGDVLVELPRTRPPRSCIVGRRDNPKPDDTRYVAFIVFEDHEDHRDFVYDRTGDMTAPQRLLWHIFSANGPDNPEPEAPTEVVTLDGATVIAVDLSVMLPGYKLYIDERLVP